MPFFKKKKKKKIQKSTVAAFNETEFQVEYLVKTINGLFPCRWKMDLVEIMHDTSQGAA